MEEQDMDTPEATESLVNFFIIFFLPSQSCPKNFSAPGRERALNHRKNFPLGCEALKANGVRKFLKILFGFSRSYNNAKAKIMLL